MTSPVPDPLPAIIHQKSAFSKAHSVKDLFTGPLAGAGWMLLACMAFTGIAVVVRFASHSLSVFEIVFFRNLFPMFFSSFMMFKNQAPIHTSYWKWAIVLAIAGVSSNLTYGYGLAHLPFSTANALNYTHPIFMAILGALLFKLPIERPVMFAFGSAFLGVILLLQPKALPSDLWFAGLITLLSGIIAGLFNLLIYRLGVLGEPSYRLLWYFSSAAVITTLLIILKTHHFHMPHGAIWLYIILLGGLTALAQLLLMRAFKGGSPHITNLFSYSTTLYAVILDIFIFQKQDFNVWAGCGIALILGGGLLVSWLNPTQRKSEPES